MTSLLFLANEDFDVRQGQNGNLLCHGIQQISLVLFYSTHCVHCQKLIPIFKRLPDIVPGCQIAMVNVSIHKNLVSISQQTITPIEYVPLIILYVNGIPHMEYSDAYNIESIRKFILEVYATIEQKISFTKQSYPTSEHPNVHYKKDHRQIPQYSIGEPLYGDDKRCYLEMSMDTSGNRRR